MRPFLAAVAAALVIAPAAAAHVDNPKQIAFEWPAQGVVTTTFGLQPDGRVHEGLDIGILRSLDVVAAAPGTVVAVGEPPHFEGYGQLVIVDLGQGLEALYAHLSAEDVVVGETVAAGDRLGTAGCTGWCTGTHLHFELRQDGEPVDPYPLLGEQSG